MHLLVGLYWKRAHNECTTVKRWVKDKVAGQCEKNVCRKTGKVTQRSAYLLVWLTAALLPFLSRCRRKLEQLLVILMMSRAQATPFQAPVLVFGVAGNLLTSVRKKILSWFGYMQRIYDVGNRGRGMLRMRWIDCVIKEYERVLRIHYKHTGSTLRWFDNLERMGDESNCGEKGGSRVRWMNCVIEL